MADKLPPIPYKGIKTNEDEARWLERTIQMRINETLSRAGINANITPIGLYDLLLLSLQSAERRAIREFVAERHTPTPGST